MILATVEYSGTRQTAIDLKLQSDQIIHLTDEAMPQLLAYQGPIYTTHRMLEQVRATWVRQRRDLADLEQQLRNLETIRAHGAHVIHLGKNRWRS